MIREPARRRMGRMIRKPALSLAVVAVVAIGVIVFGRLASSDVQAMVLTTLFFAAFAVVLFLVIRKRRDLLGWLAVPFVVTAGLAGIWLDPELAERVASSAGVISGVGAFIAGGLGVAYRPTTNPTVADGTAVAVEPYE